MRIVDGIVSGRTLVKTAFAATVVLFATLSLQQTRAQAPQADHRAQGNSRFSQPMGAPAQAAAQSSSHASSASGESSIFAGFMDAFDYDPRGRRDPFAQPIADKPVEQGSMHGPLLPLQKFDVNQLRLVGIIWDVRHPKAMIRDPDGKTHIVGPNTKIGPKNGYIAVIREGEMVVVETAEQDGKLSSTAQVVKIAR